ncbi:MAG: 2-oxoacid ferredoxin oxidoreductase [Tissierellia bacterium]|nr:2-oxoacid ferredoxin oxidoreductase [Tissierellia bacterium]
MFNQKYTSTQTQWCPGCGNFSILAAIVDVMNEMNIPKNEVLFMGGIGQAAKLNQFIPGNGFSGLHGRILPAALGVHAANPELKIIINTGDGDSYGEGGNHLIHTIRRNPDIAHFVHNNQIYGLTTGQPSPTTDVTDGIDGAMNSSIPLSPLNLALACGATFVARGFTGDREQLKEIMKAAIDHKGYALVDILQPCVTFNKVNTFKWYKDRVKPVDHSHNVQDKEAAIKLAGTWGEEIPTGILYQVERPVYTQRRPLLSRGVIPSREEITSKEIEDRLKLFI